MLTAHRYYYCCPWFEDSFPKEVFLFDTWKLMIRVRKWLRNQFCYNLKGQLDDFFDDLQKSVLKLWPEIMAHCMEKKTGLAPGSINLIPFNLIFHNLQPCIRIHIIKKRYKKTDKRAIITLLSRWQVYHKAINLCPKRHQCYQLIIFVFFFGNEKRIFWITKSVSTLTYNLITNFTYILNITSDVNSSSERDADREPIT